MTQAEGRRRRRNPATPVKGMTGPEVLAHLRAVSGRNYVAGENQARQFAEAAASAPQQEEAEATLPHENHLLSEINKRMTEHRSGFVGSYPRVQFMYARSQQLDPRYMSLVTDPNRPGLKEEAKQIKHDRIEALIQAGVEVDEYGVIQGNRKRTIIDGREYEYIEKENPLAFEPRAYVVYSTIEEQHVKVTTERLVIADSESSFKRAVHQEHLREQQEQNPA